MLPREQIEEIARINGLSAEKIRGFLQLTGDTPARDETGKVVVLSSKGDVLARLQWPEDI